MISVHKKVDDMEINCHFYPIVCYIYLLNVFWGFGSFTVVDIPYNKNIIYISSLCLGPPGRASIGTCLECLCINPALDPGILLLLNLWCNVS